MLKLWIYPCFSIFLYFFLFLSSFLPISWFFMLQPLFFMYFTSSKLLFKVQFVNLLESLGNYQLLHFLFLLFCDYFQFLLLPLQVFPKQSLLLTNLQFQRRQYSFKYFEQPESIFSQFYLNCFEELRLFQLQMVFLTWASLLLPFVCFLCQIQQLLWDFLWFLQLSLFFMKFLLFHQQPLFCFIFQFLSIFQEFQLTSALNQYFFILLCLIFEVSSPSLLIFYLFAFKHLFSLLWFRYFWVLLMAFSILVFPSFKMKLYFIFFSLIYCLSWKQLCFQLPKHLQCCLLVCYSFQLLFFLLIQQVWSLFFEIQLIFVNFLSFCLVSFFLFSQHYCCLQPKLSYPLENLGYLRFQELMNYLFVQKGLQIISMSHLLQQAKL